MSPDHRKATSSWPGGQGSRRIQENCPSSTSHWEAHLFTFGASYLLSTEGRVGGRGSPITRNQSLGLGGRNTPQIRGTTQSVVHGTRTQVLRKVMCTHTGTHTWAHRRAVNICIHRTAVHTHTQRGRFVYTRAQGRSWPHTATHTQNIQPRRLTQVGLYGCPSTQQECPAHTHTCTGTRTQTC